jgi:hypothetical protein
MCSRLSQQTFLCIHPNPVNKTPSRYGLPPFRTFTFLQNPLFTRRDLGYTRLILFLAQVQKQKEKNTSVQEVSSTVSTSEITVADHKSEAAMEEATLFASTNLQLP